MNGNNPYAGPPGTTPAGKRASSDLPELTPEQQQVLREGVGRIADRTRAFLPDEYVVDGGVQSGADGPQAMVAVQPPVGHPVTAGYTPAIEDIEAGEVISPEEEAEVARGLAASAALQVKQSVDDPTPTAR